MVIFIGICCILMNASGLVAQTGTTEGKEFYFGFLVNGSPGNPFNMSVHVSTTKPAAGILSIPGTSFRFPLSLQANESRSIPIPSNFRPNGVGVNEPIALRLTMNEDVSVYAYNELSDSGDATMVLPVQSLSDEYLIHSYNNDFYQQSFTQNQVLLVGTRDTTIYEFEPTVNLQALDETVTFPAGSIVRDTLFRGEQIAYHAVGNLSGSVVRTINTDPNEDCVPIAVFVGHVATQVDACLSSDHLFNQLYATTDWGLEYMIIPFETRFGGDVVQIMASEDNTQIQIGSSTTVNLNRGERHSFLAPIVTPITANKKISVMHLSRGKRCDENERGDDLADPFMMMLSPANQVIKNVTFTVFKNETVERFFMNMVVPSTDIEVFLDGVDISNEFSISNQNPDYAYASIAISSGTRNLRSKNGVVAHYYAFGESESYGLSVGGNLGEFDVEIIDEQRGLLVGNRVSVCEDSELEFNVTSDIPFLQETYNDFQWVLSNGVVLDGEQVTFQFNSAGVYTIDMIASKDESACSQLIVTRTIDVVENALDDIIGPASVCPNAQDIIYSVEGAESSYTYNWSVVGGSFDGSNTGTSVTIDWSIADPGAKVSVYSISPLGCLSDTIEYDIVLNEILMPATPNGPQELCADNTERIVYTTPSATGSTYTWEAVGGQIINGQGTERVEVTWSGPGIHQLRFYESTVVNNLCGGTSADLTVEVYQPISYTYSNQQTSCYGEADGSASLNIVGGLGPYVVNWTIGVTGADLTGQPAGIYQATITDALGCQSQAQVEITEPELLQVTAISRDAICNGERGFARIQVSGGTGPYSFNWSDGLRSNNESRDGLNLGDFSVVVVDANGCSENTSFRIAEPTEIEASFEIRPACPESSDGILSLLVSGGTGPYQFIWDADPNVTGNQIEGLAAGNYAVRIVDAAGCELSLTTELENVSPIVSLPSAFSPNNDGVNDGFGIIYNCALETQLAVYNKWGQLMYSSTEINEEWDGTYQGEDAPAGTYTYVLNYQTIFNGTALNKTLNGRVQLIR